MQSIVVELRKDALSRAISVSDLLRKALVVAKKLHIGDFETWISQELNGYQSEPPPYRRVSGRIQVFNTVQGRWNPVHFHDPKEAKHLSEASFIQPIAETEELTKDPNDTMFLATAFPAEIERSLMKRIDGPFPPRLTVNPASLVSIIDAVRTIVLNWALKLEEEGILGDGIAFSTEETARAAEIPQAVYNFYGNVGTSQSQVGSHYSTQTAISPRLDLRQINDLMIEMKESLEELNLDKQKRLELVSKPLSA